jgi:hypothetical protein
MDIDNFEKFNTTKNITDAFLIKKHPEYYNALISYLDGDLLDLPISQRIWLFQNKRKSIPKCLNSDCINDVKFTKFYKGYNKYCSKKCSANHTHKDINVKNSRIKKMLESNNDIEIRKSMTIKANLTKENFTDEKKENIVNKRSVECLKKYGIDNVGKLRRVVKLKNNPKKETLVKSIINKGFQYIDGYETLTLSCNSCTCNEKMFDIDKGLFFRRCLTNIEPCINKLPYKSNKSTYEIEISEFLTDNNIISETNNRTILEGKELDIYIPSHNLGIEFNGLYWHSEKYKENDYHLNKSLDCNKKGIQLLHIFEDEWIFKKEICKSIIMNYLSKSKTIYARKCIVKEVKDSKISNTFLNENHIQGGVGSKIKLGLYYEDNLVSLMTFGSLRKNLGQSSRENVFELLRFCNLLNTNIIGGATKLFKHFIGLYSPKEVISYCDISKFNGSVYEKMGFSFAYVSVPNYYYIHDSNKFKRLNRWNFRKDILVSEGYDKNSTEKQIMLDNGYYRIYDCGNKKFIFKDLD